MLSKTSCENSMRSRSEGTHDMERIRTVLSADFVFTGSALVQKGFPLGNSRVKVTEQGETRQVGQPREQARQCNYCTG